MTSKEEIETHKLVEAQLVEEQIQPLQLAKMVKQTGQNKQARDKNTPSNFELATNQVNPKDIKLLNDEFEEIYGSDMQDEGIYTFTSDAEATCFFKHQAEMGRSFLIKKAGEDDFLFSDGNDNFFQGTQDELQDFFSTLQEVPNPKAANATSSNLKIEADSSNSPLDFDKKGPLAFGV
ncbi:hypothetical protein [Legionella sp. W05-934-2]|jgi:hypothetical protein|uniref:hypothetical protein n=1 Tax=Legionella sp. W05-934-2 TaxID=1198649 RepID=UPI003461876D